MKNAYIEEVEGCKLDLESAKTSLETWYAKRYPEAEIVGSVKDWPPNYFPKCWHAVKETLMILTLWPPGTRRSMSDTWEMQRRLCSSTMANRNRSVQLWYLGSIMKS
jgi:hypothetical protein